MGFNHSSSSTSFDSNAKVSKTELFGAVLAGFGIWTKPTQATKTDSPGSLAKPCNVYPLRVIRVKDTNPQLAGRMVISGRMADVCAELDRLAA
jgi:hypothetical protein